MGRDGNAPVDYLTKFYNEITTLMHKNGVDSNIALNQDNVEIRNIVAGLGGSERETTEEAYHNYKRTIGTFNTLITLRDYMNAIVNGPELVSNIIATDRNNDTQCSYKIMSTINNVSTLVNKVDKHDGDTIMSAYNIKFYALRYVLATNTASLYNSSFELLNDTELEKIRYYVENEKAIPHEYSSIRTPEQGNTYQEIYTQPSDWEDNATSYYYKFKGESTIVPVDDPDMPFDTNVYNFYQLDYYFYSHYCLFKVFYPIECRITPVRNLDTAEQKDLKENITEALYENLNSRKVDFGQEITDYKLSEIITQSDERISLASIQHTSPAIYAVYWNGKEFISIDLGKTSDVKPYLYAYSNPKYKDVTVAPTFKDAVGGKDWGVYTFKKMEAATKDFWAMSRIEGNDGASSYVRVDDMGQYCDVDTKVANQQRNDWFSIEINPVDRFRDEIYVKSVLQGISPLFVNDTDFDYSVGQNQKIDITGHTGNGVLENVESIQTNVEMDINASTAPYYTLRENESMRFCTSNLVPGSEYSNYVKYYYVSPDDSGVESQTNRKLNHGEFLFLFWKNSDNNNDPYIYEVYSEGNIIYPDGFTLSPDAATVDDSVFREIANNIVNIGTSSQPRYVASTSRTRGLRSDENAFAESIRNWLSGTKKISLKYINSLYIPDTYSCYWVLNNKTYDNKYVLFDSYVGIESYMTDRTYRVGDKVLHENNYYECINDTTGDFKPTDWSKLPATEYILDTNELFFYKTSSGSVLNILGAGTRITRDLTQQLDEWSVNAIDASLINLDESVLDNNWFSIPERSRIGVVEQQYINIGSGATIFFKYKDVDPKPAYHITSSEDVELDAIESIAYTFNILTEQEKQDIENYDWDNKLPDMGNIDNWRVRSVLSLSIGADQEQILLSGHKLIVNFVDGTNCVLDGENDTSTQYPVVIQSKDDVESIGSSNETPVYTYDEDGNRVYGKFYVYSKQKSTTVPDRIIYNSEGGVTVTFPPDGTTGEYSIELAFNVPEASNVDKKGYILSIFNPNTDIPPNAILKAQISSDGSVFEDMYPIGTTTEYNLIKAGTYYFNVSVDNNQGYVLRLILNNYMRSEEKAVSINSLYRYSKPDGMTDELFDRYSSLILQFDPDRQYQYIYNIPEDVMIENPLSAESFLNAHHIYNQVTISQLNTAEQSYVITSR